MIPKTIHYCWFGGGQKSDLIERCIASWKKYCPDCEIIEWNESNYDVTKNPYMYQAYQAKRWGFVSDYARLDILYEHGGVYLDTDVELIKPIDDLLSGDGFLGFERTPNEKETAVFVNTGEGFGAKAKDAIVGAMRDSYESKTFLLPNGQMNLTTCPYYNTEVLRQFGLKQVDELQKVHSLTVYPVEYFCPLDWKTRKCRITANTYSIHHFDASWLSGEEKKKRKRARRIDFMLHIPNMLIKAVLGEKRYNRLKGKIKK